MKKNKELLILSGFLLLLATFFIIIYRIALLFYCTNNGITQNADSTKVIAITAGILLALAAYCYFFHDYAGAPYYYVSLGLFTVPNLYTLIAKNLRYSGSNFLFLILIFYMIIAKILTNRKEFNNKYFEIAGIVIFGLYASVAIIELFIYYADFLLFAMNFFYLVCQVLAFVFLWIFECNVDFPRKSRKSRKKIKKKSSIEENLAALKLLYDNGTISKEEYDLKKSNILDNL